LGRCFTNAIGVLVLTTLSVGHVGAAAGAPPAKPTGDSLASSATSTGDGSPGQTADSSAASDSDRERESYRSSRPEGEADRVESRESGDLGRPASEAVQREPVDQQEDEIEKAIRVFRRETAQLGVRDGSARGNANGQWHGRIYEYFRNDALDAVPHQVSQKGGTKNILRRNQFGFSINGPVVLPKLYDGRRATFFTFSYEGTRENVGESFLRTLPTAQQRQGDFSDLVDQAGNPVAVYDPASTRPNAAFDPSQIVSNSNLEFLREPFAGNQVPLSRMDPVASAVAPYYPLPNTNVGPFFQNNYWTNPPQQNTPDGFLASIDHNLLVRHKITVDLAYSKGFQGSPSIYPTLANPARPDRHFSNRRLAVRETFMVSPTAVYTGSMRLYSQGSETLGLTEGSNLPEELGLEGVGGTVFPTLRFSSYEGMGAYSGAYFRNFWNSYETEHSLTLQRGRHSWRFSTELTFYQLNTLELESPSGLFRFNEEQTGLPGIKNTGDSFASFLLGRSYSAEATDLLQPSYLRRTAWQTSVQDEFEVTPNLTATFRMRLDLSTPQVEKFDRQSTIGLDEINPEAGTPGALVFANRNGQGRAFQPVRARLEPQLGLAWSPTANRNTVVRAGFSRFYRSIPLRSGVFGTQGFSVRRTLVSPNDQLEPAVVLGNGVPPPDHPLPDLRPEAANGTNADFVDPTSRQPRFDQASLNFERRLSAGFVVRVGGEIERGKDILVGTEVAGLNAIPLSALTYRDALNNESFRRSLRPFPQFQRINTNYLYPEGHYHSESGFVEVEKRASHGLSMEFQYSLRDARDDYSGPGVQIYGDPDSAWSVSRGLRPHRVSLNYSYELPFGRGKALLNSSGWARAAFGNWSISGFTRWLSGDPIVLEPVFNNTGGVVPYLRVQAVPGIDPQVQNPGPQMWFNAAAFVEPGDFEIGDVSRTHPSLRNPAFQMHDLSITKRVSISAERSLEFLLQGFNFINHGNWADPDSSIGPPEAPNVNAGRIIESRGGRVIQLGLRYNF
jgi:hypothetical protein